MKYKYYTWYYHGGQGYYIYVLENRPKGGGKWGLIINKTGVLEISDTLLPAEWKKEWGLEPVTASQIEFVKTHISALKRKSLEIIIENII